MSHVSRLTKAELIEEIERLRTLYEQCSEASGQNGKFDEDELFALAQEIEGDELFLVSETGRFVFVNDTMLQQLGYERDELLAMSLPRIDNENSRAQWLHRVSHLKQSRTAEMFESEQIAKDGSLKHKEITALYITYRSRNYVLCIGQEREQEIEEQGLPTTIRNREETIQNMTSDGILVVDTRGIITESNSVADRLLGVSKNEVIGRSCVDSRWRLVDTSGEPLGISNHPIMGALVEENQVFNRRIDMLTHDGSRKSMLVNAAPLHSATGDLIGAIGCIRAYEDSAERSEQLQRLRTLQALERDAIDAVMNSGSEDDLERKMCQVLIKHGDYPLVWRGVTREEDMRLHPTVSAGSEAEYLMKIKVRYDETVFGKGPLGQAMKTHEPVVVNDLLTDPSYEPWRKQTERSSLHSLIALPLRYEDEQFGILTLYAKDRHHFVGPEFHAMKNIAQLLSFGISVRRKRNADRTMRNDYVVQEMMLKFYKSTKSVAVAMFDAREPFRCSFANEHFSALLDEPFKTSGVDGSYVSDFMYSLYHRDLYQRLQEGSASESGAAEDDAMFTDWQGQPMRWSWSIHPVRSETGEDTLLYMAYPSPAAPEGAAASEVPSAHAEDATGFMLIRSPKIDRRGKLESRVQRFLEQAIVTKANADAVSLFDAPEAAVGKSAGEFFQDHKHAHDFLMQLVSVKDSGVVIPFSSAAGQAPTQCTVFTSSDEDVQLLCLVFDS